jgi:transposase
MMKATALNEINIEENVSTDEEINSDELGKEEQKSKFIHLRAKGYSYAYIAKELKVSTSTLTNWNQELHEAIVQAKAMELEALQEEYFLLKEGRIKLLGEQLKNIQKEINSRDLSQVNTDKLMELLLRYFSELKTEYVEISHKNKIGIKLNSKDIAGQLQLVLERFKTGQIDESQAKLEQTILQSMLKAVEQTELAAKLEQLEAIVKSRR